MPPNSDKWAELLQRVQDHEISSRLSHVPDSLREPLDYLAHATWAEFEADRGYNPGQSSRSSPPRPAPSSSRPPSVQPRPTEFSNRNAYNVRNNTAARPNNNAEREKNKGKSSGEKNEEKSAREDVRRKIEKMADNALERQKHHSAEWLRADLDFRECQVLMSKLKHLDDEAVERD